MSKRANRIIRLLGGHRMDVSSLWETMLGKHWYVKHWPFLKKTKAITLKKVVLHRDKNPTLETIMHEERHVQQYIERSILEKSNKHAWHLSYLWESIKSGFRDNRYERDARRYARKFMK